MAELQIIRGLFSKPPINFILEDISRLKQVKFKEKYITYNPQSPITMECFSFPIRNRNCIFSLSDGEFGCYIDISDYEGVIRSNECPNCRRRVAANEYSIDHIFLEVLNTIKK
jgi:hypothetical protein